MPLGIGFPKLKRLGLREGYRSLFFEETQIGDCVKGRGAVGAVHGEDNQPPCDCSNPLQAVRYIEKVFGPVESLMGVEELVLTIVLPYEAFPGQWRNLRRVGEDKFAFGELLKRFRGLKTLELNMEPPYTKTEGEACMLVSQDSH